MHPVWVAPDPERVVLRGRHKTEPRWGHSNGVHLVGVVALGADAPAEWRDFAEAALFSYRRPALR